MLAKDIQQGGQNKKRVQGAVTSLSDLGIDRNLSSRAQRIASVPEDKFEAVIGQLKQDEQQKSFLYFGMSGGPHRKAFFIIFSNRELLIGVILLGHQCVTTGPQNCPWVVGGGETNGLALSHFAMALGSGWTAFFNQG